MFQVATAAAPRAAAELLILPLYEDGAPGPGASEVIAALELADGLKAAGVEGAVGDMFLAPSMGRVAAGSVLFVGVGSKDDVAPAIIRTAAHHAGAASRRFSTVASTLAAAGSHPVDDARAFTEGLLLGRYRDDSHKSSVQDPQVPLKTATVLLPRTSASLKRAVEVGEIHADAANWARTLVTMPSSACTPAFMAATARTMARQRGLEIKVWNDRDLIKGGFGGIIGVGKGGVNPPRMIELTYNGGGAESRLP